MKTLAAIAAQPGRPLETVLRSLAPQVDEIAVYCNGFDDVPPCVTRYAARWTLSRRNCGAEQKLFWASQWDGLYLSCDDDLEYPPDYVATMRRAVEQWHGQALVTVHGRTFDGRALWKDWVSASAWSDDLPAGRWVNYGGTGVMAFDTRLGVPDQWPRRNCLDAQVALWAQQTRTPIWLMPHAGTWLRYLLEPEARTIYLADRERRFALRNAVLAQHLSWSVIPVRKGAA